jgi:DNA ligase D-like protein (predicted polymerase)/DNA ligase D-like protein (predicted 3'-phosphoesterase)
MGLETYHAKRNFAQTPEPKGRMHKEGQRRFVVQEHHASRLHFDFRLEMAGVLKSWSVPKGPSLDPIDKRLAVSTEDHPVDYLNFEGRIADGNYGAGEVRVWDIGDYEMVNDLDPVKAVEAGKITFILKGRKLRGEFSLIRLKQKDRDWLLIKGKDKFAKPGWKLKTILGTAPKTARKTTDKTTDKTTPRTEPTSRISGDSEKEMSAVRALNSNNLSGGMKLKVKGNTIQLTNLDKVYWPEDKYTKGDLIRYYYKISEYILPYLNDRPLILKRYPNGIARGSFHQHNANVAPDHIPTVEIAVKEGHDVNYIVGGHLLTLLYTTNLGAIEQHPWHSRTRNLDHPDWIVFDLDPGEATQYEDVCRIALSIRGILNNMGLDGYAKTSGSRGMHIYVPIKPEYDYPQIANLAAWIAQMTVQQAPKIATIERSLKNRNPRQVYVDYMQNARGKSIAAPYSVRARPGATVSAPLDWKEVENGEINPHDFTMQNMETRISRVGDLFELVLSGRQNLGAALRDFKRAS